MGLWEFENCISEMVSQKENEKKFLLTDQNFRKVYRRCVKVFDDREKNLKRWLLGKPCIFYHPGTKQYMTM